MTSKNDTYTCALCKGTFESTWTEEEALAELEETFHTPVEQCAVVCDGCYKLVMGQRPILRLPTPKDS